MPHEVNHGCFFEALRLNQNEPAWKNMYFKTHRLARLMTREPWQGPCSKPVLLQACVADPFCYKPCVAERVLLHLAMGQMVSNYSI
jgi:hypothetical protein